MFILEGVEVLGRFDLGHVCGSGQHDRQAGSIRSTTEWRQVQIKAALSLYNLSADCH